MDLRQAFPVVSTEPIEALPQKKFLASLVAARNSKRSANRIKDHEVPDLVLQTLHLDRLYQNAAFSKIKKVSPTIPTADVFGHPYPNRFRGSRHGCKFGQRRWAWRCVPVW